MVTFINVLYRAGPKIFAENRLALSACHGGNGTDRAPSYYAQRRSNREAPATCRVAPSSRSARFLSPSEHQSC
jgi:hypothetical protein